MAGAWTVTTITVQAPSHLIFQARKQLAIANVHITKGGLKIHTNTRSLSSNKDLRVVLQDLEEQGFIITKRVGGHLKIRNPRMAKDSIVFIPSSPRKGSVAFKNIMSTLRRIGYEAR